MKRIRQGESVMRAPLCTPSAFYLAPDIISNPNRQNKRCRCKNPPDLTEESLEFSAPNGSIFVQNCPREAGRASRCCHPTGSADSIERNSPIFSGRCKAAPHRSGRASIFRQSGFPLRPPQPAGKPSCPGFRPGSSPTPEWCPYRRLLP